MDCAEEHAPGSAVNDRGRKGRWTVVEADGAFLGITTNTGDNGESTNHVDVMLNATKKCVRIRGTEEAGTVVTVGGEGEGEGR